MTLSDPVNCELMSGTLLQIKFDWPMAIETPRLMSDRLGHMSDPVNCVLMSGTTPPNRVRLDQIAMSVWAAL